MITIVDAVESATPTPQNAELADLLLPYIAGLVTLPTSMSATEVAALEESATTSNASKVVLDRGLSFDASWVQNAALLNRRVGGSCAPLAGSVPLSRSCVTSNAESFLVAAAQLGPTGDEGAAVRAGVAHVAALQHERRTHAEAPSDAEEPTVAVAPAASRPDNGIGASGGSPGGSSGSATSRIFAVSTLPVSLSVPVSFPTEPQPTLVPDGELGVPPPASPG